MSPALQLAVLALMGSSTAVAAGRRYLERRRARRELRARPVLAPSSPEGAVARVTGVVRAVDRTLISPLAARTCVMFRARAELVHGVGRHPGGRVETIELAPFEIVRDGAETVLVDGSHVLVDLPGVELAHADDARKEQFVLGHGGEIGHAVRSRFEEIVVEEGMTISVAGLIMKDVPAAPTIAERDYREDPSPTLRLTGNAAHPIAIGRPD